MYDNDNDSDPRINVAKILFVVFAIALAAYIILLKHSIVYAQDVAVSTQQDSIETQDLEDLEGTEKLEDPFFGTLEGVEAQQFDDLTKGREFLPIPPNPYMKPGYTEEEWQKHYEYEYFLWLEYRPINNIEQEQINKEKEQVQSEMKDAVMQHLFHCVRRSDHQGILNKACYHAYGGCNRRIDALTTYIVNIAYDLHLDPWLLAAIAMHESTFNPFAVGDIGERGYFQLNPHNGIGKRVKFVKSAHYRKKCKKKIGNCQLEVAKAAAIHLYKDFKRCGGNRAKALTAYNVGRCTLRSGRPRWEYVNKVMGLRASLESGCRPVEWCDGKSKSRLLVPYNKNRGCLQES